jgi:hypothetical protein
VIDPRGPFISRAWKIRRRGAGYGNARAISPREPRRQAADADYLDALAKRLAHGARLPLGLAVRRVQKLAVSAGPPESYRKGGQ